MSIQECIKIFFDHLEELEDRDGQGNDGYFREFRKIVNTSRKWINDNKYPATAGEKSENLKKNRYKDILPFDHCRVVLPELDGVEGTDYINANYVKGVTGKNAYIASQGPQPATIDDFWRMLWTLRINVVIMACHEYEDLKLKCKRYWPEKGEESKFCNERLSVTLVEENDYTDYVLRILQVTYGDDVRLMYQLHYMVWPDHGIPTSIAPILDMLAIARQYQPTESVPMVVHCSAGCGRTGTVLALDYTWSLLREGKLTRDYSIYNLILEFRTQRPSLVQSEDQYQFVHMAVRELFQKHLSMIEDHFYENAEIIKNYARSSIENTDTKDLEEEDDTYQEVNVQDSKPNAPSGFPDKFPSPSRSLSSLPDNAKTPEVPTLLPVPLKKNANQKAATSPRGPPKPGRINLTESPTNATIRNTLNRLYSSTSSETDTTSSEMYANVTSRLNDNRPGAKPSPIAKPTRMGVSSISAVKTGTKPSPTSPKPRVHSMEEKPQILTPKPTRHSSETPPSTTNSKPDIPGLPLKQAKTSSKVKDMVQNLNRSASSSDEHSSRQASLSDSSSVNTVFTSEKGSPSGISDISVFGSETTNIDTSPNSKSRKDTQISKIDTKPVANSEYALQGFVNSANRSDYVLAQCDKPVKPKPVQITHGAYEEVEISDKTPTKPLPSPQKTPTSSTPSAAEKTYASIDDLELDKGEPVCGGDAYAYAGVDEKVQWSLQHIARQKSKPEAGETSLSSAEAYSQISGVPSPNESRFYSAATADEEVFDTSDEEAPPAVPSKNYSQADLEELQKAVTPVSRNSQIDEVDTEVDETTHNLQPSSSKLNSGTLSRMLGKNIGLKLHKKKPTKSESSSGACNNSTPPTVTYKGKVISFGHRVGKPTGPRNNAEDIGPYS